MLIHLKGGGVYLPCKLIHLKSGGVYLYEHCDHGLEGIVWLIEALSWYCTGECKCVVIESMFSLNTHEWL